MRRAAPAAALAALLGLLVAGCIDGGDGGSPGGPAPSSDDAGTRPSDAGPGGNASGAFAVLRVSGNLRGEGPDPGSVIACSLAAPDGTLDPDARTATAREGEHGFEAGRTWLVVVDEVEVEDPRVYGCMVRTASPFEGEGAWTPQTRERGFSLKVLPASGALRIGRQDVAEGAPYEVDLAFEEGEFTFRGRVTFEHHGWWPAEAFQESPEQPAFEDPRAVWWG